VQRLFIVIPVYALVVIFLPQMEGFQTLMEPLMRIHPDVAITASVIAGIIAVAAIWGTRKFGLAGLAGRPRVAEVIGSGFVGIIIAAIFDVFQRLSGSPTNIVSLILLPLAFMAAEAVFLTIQWRLAKRED